MEARGSGPREDEELFEPADAGEFAEKPLILAPANPASWPAFRAQLAAWRARERDRLGYDGAAYLRPEVGWMRSAFCCGMVMLHDLLVTDPDAGALRVDALLADAEGFGGLDCVVLWQAYPRIGVDARNQFDFFRDLPGGLAGVRGLVEDLHAAGVRVLVPYLPWDTGTRRESLPDEEALAALVAAVGADGVFLDTLSRGADALRARLPGAVLASELALATEDVAAHESSWAQWFLDGRAPGVLRDKWLERRHMQHQVWRWDHDHTAELQSAWMNGSGIMVWENVFGTWAGWSPRDRALARAMLPVQRRYADLFAGEGWEPLVLTGHPDVYASRWSGRGLELWTVVNRSESRVEGELLPPPAAPVAELIAGRRATSSHAALPPRGIAAFLAGPPEALGDDLEAFLDGQARRAASGEHDPRAPQRVARVRPAPRAPVPAPPPGTVRVPGGRVILRVEYRVRECGLYEARDPEVRLATLHSRRERTLEATLESFALDEVPVTNAAYAAFVAASGYRPAHGANFLRHFVDGRPPAGAEDHPVTWVDLDDARAYARWAGRRLPTEAEWQHAAQGPDASRYPWGEAWDPARCNGGEETTPVRAYPGGRSAFGAWDLCGNVWEWTESERSDGRTRSCILRGGAHHRARGSAWYTEGGPRSCRWAMRFVRVWPGLDRCATIGFRCAADLPG